MKICPPLRRADCFWRGAMLRSISAFWAKIEMYCASVFAGLITLLILLNVVTRAFNTSIYWVDEAAIYAMAWMAFLAASSATHYGHSVAVTIVTDYLPRKPALIFAKFVDVCVLVFAVMMVWFCWRWFLPLEFAKAGFDPETFQSNTFNFIYAEPTLTLGIKKAWVWLIMWIFSIGLLLHAVSNLLTVHPMDEKVDAA